MFNFETTIGVEVHTALNTKTKMFSSAPNSHTDKPNTNLHVNDLGLPGIMPQPNKQAIVKALRLAKALHMEEVDLMVRFDRKNYFYQDLPKGFQITQQYHPIAKKGYIDVVVDNQPKRILIQRFHIEEDTAKQFHTSAGLFLDYNRAGSPLIEIVTDPVFENAAQVKAYLSALRLILLHNDISNAKMEEGSMRADINVSIRPFGASELGTRVEIKNINSINNVEKAINYEINRQAQNLLAGIPIIQATLRYDDQTQTTVFMREKTGEVDYRYMTEPNILQIQLESQMVHSVHNSMPKQPSELASELISFGIDQKQVDLLLDSKEMLNAFNFINQQVNDPKEVVRWLLSELLGLINKQSDVDLTTAIKEIDLLNLISLIHLLKAEEINGKQAKKILEVSFETKKAPKDLMKELNMVQIKDRNVLIPIVKKHIDANKDKIEKDYATRADRVQSMLLGLLMKETNGQANPQVANEIVRELLSSFQK